MKSRWSPPLVVLFWVVIADYLAQIPYYVVNYYIPHQTPPTVSAIVLLGLTLAWFLVGYFGQRTHRRFGFWVLLSFLLIEGLFYLRTLIFGPVAFQLDNSNLVVRIVFLIGYVTGVISLLYAAAIIAFRAQYAAHTEGTSRPRMRKGARLRHPVTIATEPGARLGTVHRRLVLAAFLIGVALSGVILAAIAQYLLFVGTLAWLNLIVWTIVAISIGLALRDWAMTTSVCAVLGFSIVFAYSIMGYKATAPLSTALPVFAVLAFIGALGMVTAGALGHLPRRIIRSAAKRHNEPTNQRHGERATEAFGSSDR